MMDKADRYLKLKAIYDNFGNDNQIDKMAEEATELLMAIIRYRSGKGDIDQVYEEMADCGVLITQFNINNLDIIETMDKKINRTIKRYGIEVNL